MRLNASGTRDRDLDRRFQSDIDKLFDFQIVTIFSLRSLLLSLFISEMGLFPKLAIRSFCVFISNDDDMGLFPKLVICSFCVFISNDDDMRWFPKLLIRSFCVFISISNDDCTGLFINLVITAHDRCIFLTRQQTEMTVNTVKTTRAAPMRYLYTVR